MRFGATCTYLFSENARILLGYILTAINLFAVVGDIWLTIYVNYVQTTVRPFAELVDGFDGSGLFKALFYMALLAILTNVVEFYLSLVATIWPDVREQSAFRMRILQLVHLVLLIGLGFCVYMCVMMIIKIDNVLAVCITNEYLFGAHIQRHVHCLKKHSKCL